MSTIMHRRKNDIYFLKNASNQRELNPLNIQIQFLNHFKQVYQTSITQLPEDIEEFFPNKIFQLDNNFLCSIPTDEEILSIIKQIASSKVSGLDGFTSFYFFQKLLGHCHTDFIEAIKNFFINVTF